MSSFDKKMVELAVQLMQNASSYIVLQHIVNDRSVVFADLFEKTSDSQIDREILHVVLDDLREENLVEEIPASLPDFNTYVITSKGLSTARVMREMDPSLRHSLAV